MRRILPALLALAAVGLAGCGAPGSSSLPVTAGGSAQPSGTTAALPAEPGSVTMGSAGFPESELLAGLYAGAMRARGVTVRLHTGIGERPAYLAALRDGSIGAVPEYTGSLLDYLSPTDRTSAPDEVDAHLGRAVAGQGLTVTRRAAAQDADTITVTRATAARYHLRTIGDLERVAGHLKLGAPAPFRTVSYGTQGLAREYGVRFQQFVSLSPGGSVTLTALRTGTVDAADLFTTDPAIARYRLVPLTDPRHLFAAQNVVPLFRRDVLTRPMAEACDAVSARLTTAVLRALDAEVAGGRTPADVARRWLSAGGLAR